MTQGIFAGFTKVLPTLAETIIMVGNPWDFLDELPAHVTGSTICFPQRSVRVRLLSNGVFINRGYSAHRHNPADAARHYANSACAFFIALPIWIFWGQYFSAVA